MAQSLLHVRLGPLRSALRLSALGSAPSARPSARPASPVFSARLPRIGALNPALQLGPLDMTVRLGTLGSSPSTRPSGSVLSVRPPRPGTLGSALQLGPRLRNRCIHPLTLSLHSLSPSVHPLTLNYIPTHVSPPLSHISSCVFTWVQVSSHMCPYKCVTCPYESVSTCPHTYHT